MKLFSVNARHHVWMKAMQISPTSEMYAHFLLNNSKSLRMAYDSQVYKRVTLGQNGNHSVLPEAVAMENLSKDNTVTT